MPGSGSPFALLPPDNSTGNFIHIVERVPVRIALPADELREHPIRPGLSTSTHINIAETGQSVWSSLATPSTPEYETDIYASELPTAEALAQDVMTRNLVPNPGQAEVPAMREAEPRFQGTVEEPERRHPHDPALSAPGALSRTEGLRRRESVQAHIGSKESRPVDLRGPRAASRTD